MMSHLVPVHACHVSLGRSGHSICCCTTECAHQAALADAVDEDACVEATDSLKTRALLICCGIWVLAHNNLPAQHSRRGIYFGKGANHNTTSIGLHLLQLTLQSITSCVTNSWIRPCCRCPQRCQGVHTACASKPYCNCPGHTASGW